MSDPQNPTFETVEISALETTPGYNYGATGLPTSFGCYTNTALSVPRVILGSGMTNIINLDVAKNGNGDFNILNLNVATRGGQTDAAAEGVSVVRPYLTYGLAPYMATIATGGPQATTLTMSGTNNQAAATLQTLLDMSSSIACNVTAVTTVGGNGAIDGNYALLTTDGAFTPSQQYTLTQASSAGAPDPQNKPTLQTLNIAPKAGSKPIAAGDLLVIGGCAPECVRALSATTPAADGSQTITANVRAQHWAGTIIFAGGPAGMWLEQTQFTKNWLRFVSWVLGAVDSKTLAVFNAVPNGMDMGYFFTGPVMLYNGGVITDVRNPDGSANGLTITLADNNGAWPVGGPVEMPNHFTCLWQVYVSNVIGNNPHARGVHFRVQGSGSAFGGTGGGLVFHTRNVEPLSSYTQGGGKFIVAPLYKHEGLIGTGLDLDTEPLGPLHLLPSNDGFSLVCLKNHNAYIGYELAGTQDGVWDLVASRVELPRAKFDGQAGTTLGVTTIQGDDGGGTTSLYVKKPMLAQYGQPSIHSEGDVVVDGKLTVGGVSITAGAQGPQGPQGIPGPQGAPGVGASGFTGTLKIAGTSLKVVNGCIQP